MAPDANDDGAYRPQDAVSISTRYGLTGLAFGFVASATRNAMSAQPRGALGVFVRSGGIMATSAVSAAIYGFAETASANLREKNDPWNSAIGGFLGGAVVALPRQRASAVVGLGAFFATVMGTFTYCGGLGGWKGDPHEDLFEKKERLRTTFRTPVEDTVSRIGEGRGIDLPGYEGRRRDILKDKYGIEVNPVKATAG